MVKETKIQSWKKIVRLSIKLFVYLKNVLQRSKICQIMAVNEQLSALQSLSNMIKIPYSTKMGVY